MIFHPASFIKGCGMIFYENYWNWVSFWGYGNCNKCLCHSSINTWLVHLKRNATFYYPVHPRLSCTIPLNYIAYISEAKRGDQSAMACAAIYYHIIRVGQPNLTVCKWSFTLQVLSKVVAEWSSAQTIDIVTAFEVTGTAISAFATFRSILG